MSKPHKIDIMPDMTGIHPLLNDFSHIRKIRNSKLLINFSNVRRIDSIGTAITLGLVFYGTKQANEFEVIVQESEQREVNAILKKLNISSIFSDLAGDELNENSTLSLFPNEQSSSLSDQDFIVSDALQYVSIFCPWMYESRDSAIEHFISNLQKFLYQDSPRSFNHEQVLKIFIELAKNTYDHSDGLGVCGFYISEHGASETIKFVYCDTGEGICQSVRDYFSEKGSTYRRLADKGSSIDLMHQAIQIAFTTKPNSGVNEGMGLSVITQCARGCGFEIQLKDAESVFNLAGLEEASSHSKMRSKSSRTSATKLLLLYSQKEN